MTEAANYGLPPRQTLNQTRLKHLRLSMNQHARNVARDTGIELATYNRLERADDPNLTLLSVATIVRLADYYRVPVGHLFTAPSDDEQPLPHPDPNADPASDVRRLGALMHALETTVNVAVLSEVLGWTLERTHAALNGLKLQLEPAGVSVYVQNGRATLRTLGSDTRAEKVYRSHPRASRKQTLLRYDNARLLYDINARGPYDNKPSRQTRATLAVLLKFGLVEPCDTDNYMLTDDVKFSLNPLAYPTPDEDQ